MRAALLIWMFAVATTAAAGNEPARLVWTDPQGRAPVKYQDWLAGRQVELDGCAPGMVSIEGDGNVIDVVVNAELYPFIAAEVGRFQADLVSAGYSARLDTMRGMNQAVLRSHLAGVTNICGAVLVGELPVAWFEDGWGTPTGEEFPIELYFMDLDGTWTDSDADGLYDAHTGDVAPEIWVGRLYARPQTWDDEVRLMRRYFDKNHAYRTGGLTLPDRALAYDDDDWSGFGDCNLPLVYSSVTTVNQSNTTRASDYRTRLTDGYEWIHICAHSSPWGHTFRVSGGYGGTVFNTELYAVRPHANFYNLFACSGTRFVEENSSCGWDVFQDDYGVAAVGSAKTGSMLNFDDFYRPLGRDSCIGDAFIAWFRAWGESDRDWFYGMNVIGDPSLMPHGGGSSAAVPEPEPGPTTAEPVGPDPETDDSPYLLAMPDGKVWAIWKSGRSVPNGRFDIYASVRSGGTWSVPYAVGSAYYWETDPCLGLDVSGRPVAVWSYFTDDYHYNLCYSIWTGSSWTAAAEMSEDCSSDLRPSLCRDSTGALWCVWSSRRAGPLDLFASSFNGSSWSAPVNLTADTSAELYPRCATMPDGTVWVAFSCYRDGRAEIWSLYRQAGVWHSSGPVSGNERRAYRPAIGAGRGGRPVVAWQSFDSGDGEIHASEFDGAGWSAPVAVGADSGLDVQPAMATDCEGKLWVTWMSDRTGNWDVYACYQDAGGWTQAQAVEPAPGPDMNPVIAGAPAGEVWVAWQGLSTNWDIFARSVPLSGSREPGSGQAGVWRGPGVGRGEIDVALPGLEHVQFVDGTGRVLTTTAAHGGRVHWDAPAPGVYFCRAVTRTGPLVRKVVVVR